MKLGLVVVLACFAGGVVSHPEYRDFFPNGRFVPNPCGSGIWSAVGHFDPSHHTQQKNAFGLAFSAGGHTWTQALCNADSDGDGRTNGQELGDPTCIWTHGQNASTSASGHPGICEPVGSSSCSHDPFVCGCHNMACIG